MFISLNICHVLIWSCNNMFRWHVPSGVWLSTPGLRGILETLETSTTPQPSLQTQWLQNMGQLSCTVWDRAMKNMDNIKETYAELSILHSEKLHVDPDNFKVEDCGAVVVYMWWVCLREKPPHPSCCVVLQLLADCLTIVLAAQMGSSFSGDVQAAFQKFMAVVVSSLGRQYH